MNQHDEKWHALLRWSGSTFESESTPPYGFITSTLARLNAEKRQQTEAERIGWRALLASLVALVVTAAVTFAVIETSHNADFDPGVRGLVAIGDIPLS